MEKRTVRSWGVLLILTLVLACQHQGALADTKDAGMRQAEPTAFDVPENLKQAWDNIHNYLQQEYDVCIEHCSFDASCEEKCEKVFNYRKQSEYNKFIQGSRRTD